MKPFFFFFSFYKTRPWEKLCESVLISIPLNRRSVMLLCYGFPWRKEKLVLQELQQKLHGPAAVAHFYRAGIDHWDPGVTSVCRWMRCEGPSRCRTQMVTQGTPQRTSRLTLPLAQTANSWMCTTRWPDQLWSVFWRDTMVCLAHSKCLLLPFLHCRSFIPPRPPPSYS